MGFLSFFEPMWCRACLVAVAKGCNKASLKVPAAGWGQILAFSLIARFACVKISTVDGRVLVVLTYGL